MNEADDLYARAQYKRAAGLYEQDIQGDPNNALAHQGLARCMFKLQDFGRAWTEANRALELEPRLPILYVLLANVSSARGNPVQAEAQAKHAIDLDPGMWQAYVSLANALMEQSRVGESVPLFEKAIDLAPAPWEAHLAFSGGLQRHKMGSESVKQAAIAFRLHPSFRTAYWLWIVFQYPRRVLIALIFVALFLGAIWLPGILSYVVRLLVIGWVLFLEIGQMRYGRRNRGIAVLVILLLVSAFYLFFRPPR